MRDKSIWERAILLTLALTLLATLASAQRTASFPTNTGTIYAEQCVENCITFTYEGASIDVVVECIDKAGKGCYERASSILIMAFDARTIYQNFVKENELPDVPYIRDYYKKTVRIRSKIAPGIPEYAVDEAARKILEKT